MLTTIVLISLLYILFKATVFTYRFATAIKQVLNRCIAVGCVALVITLIITQVL
jgi:hypothetical protein